MAKQSLTRNDIMDMPSYEKTRAEKRQDVVALKRDRRIGVGPYATFYFECYDTMWWQVHEMLRIEKGGEEQIADELAAYNPLIPKGDELVATVMFEIDDLDRRKNFLAKLSGIEETTFLKFGTMEVRGKAEADVDRTAADGKASSVHYIHFPFTTEQKAAFSKAGTKVTLGFDHPSYAHMTILPENIRTALAQDFT